MDTEGIGAVVAEESGAVKGIVTDWKRATPRKNIAHIH